VSANELEAFVVNELVPRLRRKGVFAKLTGSTELV
jgi:hypothetical protein